MGVERTLLIVRLYEPGRVVNVIQPRNDLTGCMNLLQCSSQTAPSSSGLGRWPLKPETGIRLPLGPPSAFLNLRKALFFFLYVLSRKPRVMSSEGRGVYQSLAPLHI